MKETKRKIMLLLIGFMAICFMVSCSALDVAQMSFTALDGLSQAQGKNKSSQYQIDTIGVSFIPITGIDTPQSVIDNIGQPAETFVSPSSKVKVLTYHQEYKGYPMCVLAFIEQKLHKIIAMTPENYQGFRAELTGKPEKMASLFGISE